MDPKIYLRSRILPKRHALPSALRERWSVRIVEVLLRHFGPTPKGPLGVFWPTAVEPNLSPLLQRWLHNGVRLVLPVQNEERRWQWRQLLHLPKAATPHNLPAQSLGAEQKPKTAIVPGLAFDSAGRRLGHGGGTYDRLLAERIDHALGCIFPFQLVAHVPTDRWDVRVNGIVTPTRLVWTQPLRHA